MKTTRATSRTDDPPVLVRNSPALPAEEAWLADGAAATPAGEGDYCAECGQLFVGRTAPPAGKEAEHSWWAGGLIALGVALMVTFGLSAWQAARERAATQNLIPGPSAWQTRLEGPSVQRAALRAASPPGVVDRYIAATSQLNRAVAGTRFALAMVILGISLVARRATMRRADGRRSSRGAITRPALLDPVIRRLFEGWALIETIALAAFRLLTVAFLYLLSGSIAAGAPPTWDVLQETLDRVIQIVARLPDLVG